MTLTDSRRNLLVALAVLALMVGFVVWSYQYDPQSRLVPLIVGWAGIVLCLLDVVAHIDHPVGRAVGMVLSGTAHAAEDKDQAQRRFPREAMACLWMIVAAAGVILLGFLIAVPIYIFSYLLLHGGRSVRQSGVIAAATTMFIWICFEVLLRYEVFRGILFEE